MTNTPEIKVIKEDNVESILALPSIAYNNVSILPMTQDGSDVRIAFSDRDINGNTYIRNVFRTDINGMFALKMLLESTLSNFMEEQKKARELNKVEDVETVN